MKGNYQRQQHAIMQAKKAIKSDADASAPLKMLQNVHMEEYSDVVDSQMQIVQPQSVCSHKMLFECYFLFDFIDNHFKIYFTHSKETFKNKNY